MTSQGSKPQKLHRPHFDASSGRPSQSQQPKRLVETLGKKQWSKQSHLATSREDIREAHTIVCIVLLNHCSHRLGMS